MDSCGDHVLKISIFGHSFVKRLTYFVKSDPAYLNMGLPSDQFHVGLYGIGGLKLNDTRLNQFDQKMSQSDVLIVELGSNCLCDPTLGVFTFVSKLLTYVTDLQTKLNVKVVAISQILPRAEAAQPFPGYNNKVIIVNEYIDYQLRVGSYPEIYLWRHRAGLWKSASNCMHKDGVHLSFEEGYTKYYHSIRDAILRMKNKL